MHPVIRFLISRPILRLKANRAISAANIHRDRGDWERAAALYRLALSIDPGRRPIWVQLGHAEKEAGNASAALEAYRQASALPGHDGDAPLHFGMLARQMGHMPLAKEAFLQSFAENSFSSDVRRELLIVLNHPDAVTSGARIAALRWQALEDARIASVDWQASSDSVVVFDISDLIGHFNGARLPTGIQRVQMEAIRHAAAMDARTQIGCYSEEHHGWLRIPLSQFDHACALAVEDGDTLSPQWICVLEELAATLAQKQEVHFEQGSFLVNLGASWSLKNYLLNLRTVQKNFGVHYVPFLHDFIPIVTPQYHVRDLTEDFVAWVTGIFDHADFFLVNSRSTLADLNRVAARLGHQIAPEHVAVIPLDADFRRPEDEKNEGSDDTLEALAGWNLVASGFVLFVSTVEVRKNHTLVFEAWRMLIACHGAQAVPDLVCVGNPGWLNDRIYAMLEDDPLMASKVRMLSHLSDRHLAMLYRTCRFTVYPSRYEGWGLPVTEALCHGKVPILARSSSLPEAGGEFALYFEPDDAEGLVAHVEALWFDNKELLRLEEKIARDFQPRSWSDIVLQIYDSLRGFAHEAHHGPREVPVARLSPATLYRMGRNQSICLIPGASMGELIRHGSGWQGLDAEGCQVRPEGGHIIFEIDRRLARIVCHLRLCMPENASGMVGIASGLRKQTINLPAGQPCWVSVEAPVIDSRVSLVLTSPSDDAEDVAPMSLESRDALSFQALILSPSEQAQDLAGAVRSMAQQSQGDYALLRDLHYVLLNRDIDLHPMEEGLCGGEDMSSASSQFESFGSPRSLVISLVN